MIDNQEETKNRDKESPYLSTQIVDKFVDDVNITKYSVSTIKLNSLYIERYKSWLNKNLNANMAWMKRNMAVRENLNKRFPWAKSVIVVADNYYLDKVRNPDSLKISRYAWGDDYHIVLKDKLQTLLNKLKKNDTTLKGKIYVDTGPFMEKAYAEASGLGWRGKNSLILVPGIGSFVFLGLLIINKNVDNYGHKIKNRCDTCDSCQKSCPTGALDNPYQVNANKCIAYFSVEKKGDLSATEQAWLNDWLYGCDICQQSCPYNQKWATTGTDINYYNRIKLMEKSSDEWKELTEYAFGKIFRKNVIKRLKFDRFRRNLLAVIQNL